tara:strand:- start:354 stop:572 length:219 start_codon:yes stop_codon:yes gene_type:complete
MPRKKGKKINVLLNCKICNENVLVKNKFTYFRKCECGNIEVDTAYDMIKIDKVSQVKWKMKEEWYEFKEEEE